MNDEEKNSILPTREGVAQGHSTERQMRANLYDTNSCRTALRTNPDGSTTMLRTRGGWCEYTTEIATEETEAPCKLDMDSGVVDLLAASFLHNNQYDDSSGLLYRTPYVQQVIDGPVGGATGPVIGEIKPPKSAGVAPDDGQPAESFIASETKGSPYDKKRVAVLVPPSIFTGKMRMYVQAIYGRHDHAEMLRLPPGGGIGQPPLLYMDWTKKFGTEENPVTGSVVAIDTNSGIYTDYESGEHHLICVDTSSVRVYKLTPSPCAKKLRAAMLDPSTPDGDKKRIEAYILSESKPDVASVQTVTLNIAISNQSMGYGWHFNLDGTHCDIVHNSMFEVYGGVENESIHYSIAFTKSPTGEFTAVGSIIEGPTRWKSLRDTHAIAFPAYPVLGLVKFGSASSGPSPYGNAPFYVFYTGNERKVCRFSASTGTISKTFTKTPWYWDFSGSYYRMGGDAVDCTLFNDYSESLVTLSCGSISIQYGDGSTSTSFYRSTACGISEEDAAIISLSEQYVEDPFQAQDGYPEDPEAAIPHATASTPYGDSVVQTAIGSGEGTTLDPVYFGTITATPPNQTRIETLRLFGKIDQDIGYGLITRQVSFIAVVPFYDSEAVYLKGTKTTNTANVYDRSIGESMSGWQGGRWYPLDTPGGGLFSAYAKFGSPDGIATGGTQYGLTENISNTSEYSAMICNSGTYLNPAFPSERSFSSTTDIVMQKYPTYESASGESVYAPDNGINDGLGGVSLADKPFSFVGWA